MKSWRNVQLSLLSMSAVYMFLVFLNNILDYQSNYNFVQHVLTMDTTFPQNSLMYRSIQAPWVHKLGYIGIIIWEGLSALLLILGSFQLWQARDLKIELFKEAKKYGNYGLLVSLILWFFGFMTIGGEYFLMWQSETWNGLNASFRMFTVMSLILIVLQMDQEKSH